MVVFGGAGLDGVAKADIHILDVPTLEWTLGQTAGANQAGPIWHVLLPVTVSLPGEVTLSALFWSYCGGNARRIFFHRN
jgi:hypothetical protein